MFIKLFPDMSDADSNTHIELRTANFVFETVTHHRSFVNCPHQLSIYFSTFLLILKSRLETANHFQGSQKNIQLPAGKQNVAMYNTPFISIYIIHLKMIVSASIYNGFSQLSMFDFRREFSSYIKLYIYIHIMQNMNMIITYK